MARATLFPTGESLCSFILSHGDNTSSLFPLAEFFSILFTYFCIVHRFKLLNDKNFYYNYVRLIMKHLKLNSEFYLLPDEGLLVCPWNLINSIWFLWKGLEVR